MNILFLDDDIRRQRQFRSRFPGAVITATADEVIAQLPKEAWDFVLLDHDLGGDTFVNPDIANCGTQVVAWIEQNPPTVKQFIVHSFNYEAAWGMVCRLQQMGYNAQYIPFNEFDTIVDTICPSEEE